MTLDELKDRIIQIRDNSYDDEMAHSMEDDPRQEVLQAIADGHPEAKELAAEVLKTSEISFARWCA